MQSICVCCATEHPELSQTAWKSFMGLGVIFITFFLSILRVLHFSFFFHILKWLEKLELIIWMQLGWILCFILILCHHDLPGKSPSVLIAVDKIYITFISPWTPKAIGISSLIFFIAFSPCHRDQVHIYQTPSKSSVLLCCFAISSIYDRTLTLVWLFLQFFLSLKLFLFWILIITAVILQVFFQSPSLMRGAHHQIWKLQEIEL